MAKEFLASDIRDWDIWTWLFMIAAIGMIGGLLFNPGNINHTTPSRFTAPTATPVVVSSESLTVGDAASARIWKMSDGSMWVVVGPASECVVIWKSPESTTWTAINLQYDKGAHAVDIPAAIKPELQKLESQK